MKKLAHFIVKNFLLCALAVFFATKIFMAYVISEHQADMMVEYAKSSNHFTPEESAINSLSLSINMLK